MKIYTNIAHKRLKDNEWCYRHLDREYWGETNGRPDWNMTCMVCGFSRIVNNETFCRWQYCNKFTE